MIRRLTPSSPLMRTRWAALGAAVAVSLGAGGSGFFAHAGLGATPSSFVAITPCRLFDTRPTDLVGNRSTPLAAGEEFLRQVSGSAQGNCSIPAGATAISYVLTVPSSINGYLTVFPADVTRPSPTSNLNPVAGEGVKANAGIVGLSATGAIKVFTQTGPLNALLDITGYFVAAPPKAYSAWDTIPSGQTVTGTINYDTHRSTIVGADQITIDLPGLAPGTLAHPGGLDDNALVNFSFDPTRVGDGDVTCLGSVNVPLAPAGKVCIYLTLSAGVNPATLVGAMNPDLTHRSFSVVFNTVAAGVGDEDEFVEGTWAYTAP